MGSYRSLSPRRRSRSPPPPATKRFDDPRRRSSPAPSGLLVRNVSLDTRSEDLRVSFERYGPVKDVYLPKNYYTREPQGFAFVKFRHPEDALEAKEQLNQTVIGGREIRIVFADENRKTPQEMRKTGISGRHGGSNRRRTPSRSPRSRNRSYSRSASPARHYSRSISHSRSPRGRSRSPKETSRGEKRYRLSSRSLTTRENAPHDADYNFSKRSPHSREKVSLVKGDHRPSQRSQSPREFSPNVVHKKLERRTSTPRRSSPIDANTSKRIANPREFSPRIGRKGELNKRAPLSDDSPDKKRSRNGRRFSRSRS